MTLSTASCSTVADKECLRVHELRLLLAHRSEIKLPRRFLLSRYLGGRVCASLPRRAITPLSGMKNALPVFQPEHP